MAVVNSFTSPYTTLLAGCVYLAGLLSVANVSNMRKGKGLCHQGKSGGRNRTSATEDMLHQVCTICRTVETGACRPRFCELERDLDCCGKAKHTHYQLCHHWVRRRRTDIELNYGQIFILSRLLLQLCFKAESPPPPPPPLLQATLCGSSFYIYIDKNFLISEKKTCNFNCLISGAL